VSGFGFAIALGGAELAEPEEEQDDDELEDDELELLAPEDELELLASSVPGVESIPVQPKAASVSVTASARWRFMARSIPGGESLAGQSKRDAGGKHAEAEASAAADAPGCAGASTTDTSHARIT
jgi:hypothetical protein